MDEVDIEAVSHAKDQAMENLARGVCGGCEKPMYKQPLFPGAVSEWKHVSTSQPLSWNPEKHLASETAVRPHGHRFVALTAALHGCDIEGCGAEMLQRVIHAPDSLEGRAAKAQASRQRGSFNSRIGKGKRQPIS